MKIRIKGNSVRFRLTQSEVDYFSKFNYLEEKTEFGKTNLLYALKASDTPVVAASFEDNKITMYIPAELAQDWTSTERVGVEGEADSGNGKKLFLLLEKDFKCLDNTIEDQSDNYENPLAAKS
jgi:hypothetical protein